jgi:hypothetical protein
LTNYCRGQPPVRHGQVPAWCRACQMSVRAQKNIPT